MSLWAVVPAAGSGSRMASETPKQLLSLAGKPLLSWTVEALLACPRIEGCMLALSEEVRDALPAAVADHPRVHCCAGGASRAESVANAIAALPTAPGDWVLVHDAARPCLPLSYLDILIDRVLDTGVGALLAQPVSDTLKRGDADARVEETVSRDNLWRAQTPQMFRVDELSWALAAARRGGAQVTDEASAMEQAGHPVQLVAGPACNLKVTFSDDLPMAEAWLAARADDAGQGAEI